MLESTGSLLWCILYPSPLQLCFHLAPPASPPHPSPYSPGLEQLCSHYAVQLSSGARYPQACWGLTTQLIGYIHSMNAWECKEYTRSLPVPPTVPIILTDLLFPIIRNRLICAAPLSDSKNPHLPVVYYALCFLDPITNSVQRWCFYGLSRGGQSD